MSAVTGLFEAFQTRSGELSFLDRLDDLRGRLISSAVVVVLTTGFGFYAAAWPIHFQIPRWTINLGAIPPFTFGGWTINLDVLAVATAPVQPYLGGGKIKYLSPTDPFVITLKLALCIGLTLALPYLLVQIWRLVTPLLRPAERKLIGPSIIAGVVLFGVGVVFCYLLVVPLMLRFMLGFQTASLEQSIVIGEYLRLVLRMLAAFGLTFELPIIVLIATVLGLVTPEMLSAYRRHAIAIFTIASALITPPDVGSLLLLLVPMLFLYEVSIVLSRTVVKRRDADVSEA